MPEQNPDTPETGTDWCVSPVMAVSVWQHDLQPTPFTQMRVGNDGHSVSVLMPGSRAH